MTKKLVLLIPAVALLLFTVVFSAGCNFFGVNGEYYLYENNELNTDVYIKLSNGKWSSSGLEMSYSLFGGDDIEINSGTYQISNGLISFTSDYIPEYGTTMLVSSNGFCDRGGLEFRGKSFYKKGRQRESVRGS